MLFTTQRTATASLLALTLAACSGGSGGGDNSGGGNSTPQASTGYAQPTDKIRNNVTFTVPQGTWIKREFGQPTTTQQPDVAVRFGLNVDDPSQIYITYNGETYLAQRTGSSGNSYLSQSTEDGQIIRRSFERQLTTSSNVVAGGLATISNPTNPSDGAPINYVQSGYIVYGFDTDPSTIGAETGSAYYSGTIRANGYQDANVSSASGNMTLSANFDSNTINGNFNLSNLSGMTGTENYTMQSTAITGNGFSGNITVTDGSLQSGQTLQNGGYQGNFYGAAAEAVGGTINMTIQDGAESPIFIQGGFVADEVLP